MPYEHWLHVPVDFYVIAPSAPTVDEASSSAVMRLSVPEFERSVLLFEESNRGCDQDFEGEIPDQLRRGVAEECPNTVDPVTPDLLNQLLAERVRKLVINSFTSLCLNTIEQVDWLLRPSIHPPGS